jgi:hypothetical protein
MGDGFQTVCVPRYSGIRGRAGPLCPKYANCGQNTGPRDGAFMTLVYRGSSLLQDLGTLKWGSGKKFRAGVCFLLRADFGGFPSQRGDHAAVVLCIMAQKSAGAIKPLIVKRQWAQKRCTRYGQVDAKEDLLTLDGPQETAGLTSRDEPQRRGYFPSPRFFPPSRRSVKCL